MKGRVGLCAVGLLALFSQVGCGGEYEEPAGNRVPVIIPAQTAPTNVTATPGNTEATVSWTAPTSNGGRPGAGYTVRTFQDGNLVKSQQAPETTATVTGLANGTTYTFTVAARNDLSEGPQSTPSAPVVPRAVPNVPGNVAVTPGNREVTVSWDAPEDNGMALTGYTAVLTAGDTEVARQTVTGTSATFEGLTNGTTYRITVTANNAIVAGPASAPVEVTPRTVPAAPREVTTRLEPSGNGTNLIISCVIDDNGGARILNYSARLTRGGEPWRTTSTGTCNITIFNVSSGIEYVIYVFGTNEAGPGPESAPVTVTPP
jgi:hypothetical protein